MLNFVIIDMIIAVFGNASTEGATLTQVRINPEHISALDTIMIDDMSLTIIHVGARAYLTQRTAEQVIEIVNGNNPEFT